jgi:hypothetical protein
MISFSGTLGRLGLTFGAGEQIALTHFHTYNHGTIITLRMPFSLFHHPVVPNA